MESCYFGIQLYSRASALKCRLSLPTTKRLILFAFVVVVANIGTIKRRKNSRNEKIIFFIQTVFKSLELLTHSRKSKLQRDKVLRQRLEYVAYTSDKRLNNKTLLCQKTLRMLDRSCINSYANARVICHQTFLFCSKWFEFFCRLLYTAGYFLCISNFLVAVLPPKSV